MNIKFFIREEKVGKSFYNYIAQNRLELLKNGWDIGKSRISLLKNSVNISIVSDIKIPCLEMAFMLTLGEDINKDIKCNSEIIEKVVSEILNKVPKAKITIDVTYSVSKYYDLSLDEIKRQIYLNDFKENNMQKMKYRKFECVDKRYVTTNIIVNDDETSIIIDFEVKVENVIVNTNNMIEEIEKSAYLYYRQYTHYLPC